MPGSYIAPDARSSAPTCEPQGEARARHRRHAQRHEPEDQPERCRSLSGVQHVDGFRDALPPGQIAPGQQRTGALIMRAGTAIGLDRKDVCRVVRCGKRQAAQFSGRGLLQDIQLRKRCTDPAARISLHCR